MNFSSYATNAIISWVKPLMAYLPGNELIMSLNSFPDSSNSLKYRNRIIKSNPFPEKHTYCNYNYIDHYDNKLINENKDLFDSSKLELIRKKLENTLDNNDNSFKDDETIRIKKKKWIEDILEDSYSQLDCQAVAIFLFSAKDGRCERVGFKGKDLNGGSINNDSLPYDSYKINEDFVGKAITPEKDTGYGKTFCFKSLENEEFQSKNDYLSILGDLKCAIVAPLNGKNKTYGALLVINKKESKSSFNKNDISSVNFCAGVIACAISNFHRDVKDEFLEYLRNSLIKSDTGNFSYSKFYKEVLEYLTGEQTAFKACIFRTKDEISNVIEYRYSRCVGGTSSKKNNDPRKLNQGFVGLTARTSQAQIIEKITESGRINQFINSEWVENNNLESFGCFPIIDSETKKVIGTISLFTGYEYKFHRDSLIFIEQILSSLSAIIQKEKKVKSYKFNKIDFTLIHDFRIIDRESIMNKDNDQELHENVKLLPMIVRVNNLCWSSEKIPDYHELYRLDDIIGCHGSIFTVKALSEDEQVIYIESSDSSGN